MPLTDELLDNISKDEFRQLNFLQRFAARSYITKTSRLRSLARITPPEPMVFKPTTIFLAIAVSFPLTIVLFAALKGALSSGFPLVGGLVFLPILVLVIYFLLNQYFLSKGLNYTITLTREGIAFDDDFFNWTDIQETAILHLPTGKSGTDYLVLLFSDNNYEKWNLTNFYSFPWIFNEKLATHIEYFKALKANN